MAQSNYIGVDIEVPSASLPTSFEEAHFIHGDLLTVDIPKGQVVLCLETLGINSLFGDNEQIRPAIAKLSEAVHANGALLFNASKLNAGEIFWIRQFLRENYSTFSHHRYGRGVQPRPILSSILAAGVMFFSERGRVPDVPQEQWHVFMAIDKREQSTVTGKELN